MSVIGIRRLEERKEVNRWREDLARIEEVAPKGVAAGERYADMSEVNR